MEIPFEMTGFKIQSEKFQVVVHYEGGRAKLKSVAESVHSRTCPTVMRSTCPSAYKKGVVPEWRSSAISADTAVNTRVLLMFVVMNQLNEWTWSLNTSMLAG